MIEWSLNKDISRILVGVNFELDAINPNLNSIDKAFEVLDKFAGADELFQNEFNFLSKMLRKCVFCKRVDVPQILIEQIQANNERSAILTSDELPYFSINWEFVNCLNTVIGKAKDIKEDLEQKIKEFEMEIQNKDIALDSLESR